MCSWEVCQKGSDDKDLNIMSGEVCRDAVELDVPVKKTKSSERCNSK